MSTITDRRLAALIKSFKNMRDLPVGRDTLEALRELAELRVNHRWLLEDRNRYQRLTAELERRLGYRRQNPLGGPAKMFRAMAERLEAGDSWDSVLRDYGVTVAESPALSRRRRSATRKS